VRHHAEYPGSGLDQRMAGTPPDQTRLPQCVLLRDIAPLWPLKDAGGPGLLADTGAFPPVIAHVGDLGPTNAICSPELGRSPFWERSSRALPNPEDLPGECYE
jgi:hypothetical protein